MTGDKNKIVIKALLATLFALLLAVCLMGGTAKAEISSVSVSSFGSDEPLNVYVRAFVPGKYSKPTAIGHFDFMIEGSYRFRGKTFVNPVFSYRLEDSRLDVFSERDTGRIYPHGSMNDYYFDCDIYQARYRVGTKSKVKPFLNALNKSISSSGSHPRCSRAIKCKLKGSSPFAHYSTTKINCFYAVAIWLDGFGEDSLLDYYNDAHRGKREVYLPKTIVRKYSRFKRVS